MLPTFGNVQVAITYLGVCLSTAAAAPLRSGGSHIMVAFVVKVYDRRIRAAIVLLTSLVKLFIWFFRLKFSCRWSL